MATKLAPIKLIIRTTIRTPNRIAPLELFEFFEFIELLEFANLGKLNELGELN